MRKGRDSQRKPRPFPSFDRVARQQSPTTKQLSTDAAGVKFENSATTPERSSNPNSGVAGGTVGGNQYESRRGIQSRIPFRTHGVARCR